MNSAENVSVKPCPFCGGTDVRIAHVNSRSDIFCETCKTSGPSIWHGGPNADRLTLNRCDNEAIAAWNLRSPPTEDADRVEAVESARDILRDILSKPIGNKEVRLQVQAACLKLTAALSKDTPDV